MQELNIGPDIRLDTQLDIRFIFTNQQNCMKLGVSTDYITIKKKNELGKDLTIFGSVIRPDIQPDICFSHTYEQIYMKLVRSINNVILKYDWKFKLDPHTPK